MLFDVPGAMNNNREKPIESFAFDSYFPKHVSFIGEPWTILSKHIGKLEKGSVVNFWTFGRFAMADVLNYIVRQIGPSKVNACTWAITVDSVQTILNRMNDGLITDFKLWIDPRVRVRNPEPLQMCMANFSVAIKPVHAKVCTFYNDEWKISVSGSLNFTSNPQPERGVIQCIDSVYENDNQIIENEFRK
jgi:hypothetical protein